MGQLIEVSRDADVAVVALARPPVNAINLALAEEAAALLAELDRDDSARALVVTGRGDSFSAGLDLREVPSYDQLQQRKMVEVLNRLFHALYNFRKPVVAAVNGHAVADGLILALACDHRVATSAPSRVGLTEVRVGVPYPLTAMAVVRAELGMTAARTLVLGAENVGPEIALALGVFDELAAPEAVLPRALAVAKARALLPAAAFAHTKRSLRAVALAEMKEAAQGRDPVKHEWLNAHTVSAAAALLSDEKKA